jgi:ABC-2 type transport system permease protein
MKNIWIITRRELATFFNSLMAYIMIVAFLGFSGFFTWFLGSDVFFIKQASLEPFFNIAFWTLFFFIPGLTMRQFAEENRSGTIELLLTKPVSDWEVVMGKFSATFLLIAIALLMTMPYYITLSFLGPVDHGAVWTAYLGLLLMSGVYISIGLFTSSISKNQIVGYLLALFIGIFFQIIFSFIAGYLTGFGGEVFNFLSVSTHMESISRGVIDSRDVLFFLSLIFLGLILTEANLEKSRI